MINEDYTKSLFDEKWILRNFKVILDEYSSKIENFSIERRKQEAEFQRQKGYKEAQDDIKMGKNGNLPFDVPSVDIMKEMLTDEICKICNRPAHKGSEPYKFMEARLDDYKKIVAGGARKKKETLLFPNEYLGKLKPILDMHLYNRLSPEEITESINQRKENNRVLIEAISELNLKLEAEEEKKAKIISFSNETEEASHNNLIDYRKWIEDLQDCKREENLTRNIMQIDSEIKSLYEEAKITIQRKIQSLQRLEIYMNPYQKSFLILKIGSLTISLIICKQNLMQFLERLI
ncbi:MAG: hypothetical protein IPG24_25940 [Leptospiraceae bacterium]|nr:hypothetical protein [Leptospiraceae bacterium]